MVNLMLATWYSVLNKHGDDCESSVDINLYRNYKGETVSLRILCP